MHYPKWLYHAEKEAVIVNSKEAHEALGDDWVESPADIVAAAPKLEEKKVSKRSKSTKGDKE